MNSKIISSDLFDIYTFDNSSELRLLLVENGISAGFPDSSGDLVHIDFDLNTDLIKNPASTFFARLKGNKLTAKGFFDGDLLIVDRSLIPKQGNTVLCIINDAFAIRMVDIKEDGIYFVHFLEDDNFEKFDPEKDKSNPSSLLWGVVTYSIRKI